MNKNSEDISLKIKKVKYEIYSLTLTGVIFLIILMLFFTNVFPENFGIEIYGFGIKNILNYMFLIGIFLTMINLIYSKFRLLENLKSEQESLSKYKRKPNKRR